MMASGLITLSLPLEPTLGCRLPTIMDRPHRSRPLLHRPHQHLLLPLFASSLSLPPNPSLICRSGVTVLLSPTLWSSLLTTTSSSHISTLFNHWCSSTSSSRKARLLLVTYLPQSLWPLACRRALNSRRLQAHIPFSPTTQPMQA